jgi:hypothetical protein
MILFHKKVRENGTSMAEAWDSWEIILQLS